MLSSHVGVAPASLRDRGGSVATMNTTRNTLMALGALVAGCGGGDNKNSPDAAPDAAPIFPGGAAIPLATPDGSFYSVLLGINSVNFALDIDTGSASAGIAAATCTGCPVTPLYTPGAAAVDTHTTATTQYADGSGWSGEVITDKVGLAHSTPEVNVSFVAISTQMNGFFADNSYQGILGLGPAELLEGSTTSLVDAVQAAGVKPIMGFEFCSTGGTMWLGGFDATHASSAMQFTPMVPISQQNPFYAIDISDMGIGGTSLGFGSSTFNNPIVDTGTSLFYIPTPVDTALLAAVNNSAGFKALFPGSTLSDNACAMGATTITDAMVDAMLPAMSLSFPAETGGGKLTVSASPTTSYLYQMSPGQYCFAFADGGSGSQYFGVMGDTVLRGFVTVVDVENHRVGFGTDSGCKSGSAFAPLIALPSRGRIHEHGHPHKRLQR